MMQAAYSMLASGPLLGNYKTVFRKLINGNAKQSSGPESRYCFPDLLYIWGHGRPASRGKGL